MFFFFSLCCFVVLGVDVKHATQVTPRYFTKQELARAPSVMEPNMNDAKVKTLLKKAIEFLQKTGMSLRLPQLTIATAVVYFQRFYVVHSLKRYDIFKLAAAALFLAGKVEETPKKLKDLVITAWQVSLSVYYLAVQYGFL